MTEVGGVHIVVDNEQTTIARVRDDAGIWDVTRSTASRWECTCSDEACHHVASVKQVIR